MRLSLHIFAIVLLMFLVLLPIVNSFNIPSDTEDLNSGKALQSNPSSSASGENSANSGDDSGHSQIVGIKESLGAPVQLIKEFSPDNNESNLINTTSKIWVEVQLMDKELKYIQILESIDPSLEVINISKFYIINNLLDLPRIEKGFEHPEHINELTKGIVTFTALNNTGSNNTFSIGINNVFDSEKLVSDHIDKKGRIIYWYYIKLKNSGIYGTKTIIRTNDEYPDVYQTAKIDVHEPDAQFEVSISGLKTELDSDEILDVTYYVKYLGGSVKPYICDLSINDSSNTFKVAKGPSRYQNEWFNVNEIKRIQFYVKYPNEGKYYLPDLVITSKNTLRGPSMSPYTFKKDDVVEVKGVLKRNTDIITWLLLGIGIILSNFGIMFSHIYGSEIKSNISRIKLFIHNNWPRLQRKSP